MKKSIVSFIITLAIILFSINMSYAAGTTAAVDSINEKGDAASLEQLLKDEKEQEKIQKIKEENKVVEEESNQENATLAAQDKDYTIPTGVGEMRYLKGIDFPGYDFYINPVISYNSTTGTKSCYFKLYKHDVINNTNELILEQNGSNQNYITYYYRDKILYILYITNYNPDTEWKSQYTTSNVIGINVETNAIVMNQKFNCTQVSTKFPSFAVDGEQRVYLPYEKTGLKIFDKSGKLLYTQAKLEDNTDGIFIYVKGVTPNNKALLFQVMMENSQYPNYSYSLYEGMQKLNNGTFVYKESFTAFINSTGEEYSPNPRWYFLDSAGTYAVDQYGRVAKFSYETTNENNIMGLDEEILLSFEAKVSDYGAYTTTPVYPNVCKNGNYAYIMGANCNIYKLNIKTLECNEYIRTDYSSYTQVYSINYYEQSLFVYGLPKWERVMQQIKLDSSNIVKRKDIVNSTHSTAKRSVEDVVAKYKATAPVYNYANSIYSSTPSWKKTYKAGSLNSQVILDTRNRLNYYRWLVGVSEIPVNSSKMSRSQKGAVISKANNMISHYPTQPSDMPDDFYKEAYDGCNAKYEKGDIYSGNVSYGYTRPYQAIEGFVNDLNNISYGSATGHRQSMLDPKAISISFGQCDIFSTASVYYNPDKDISKESFYAFPSAGYFPNNEMLVGEYWSIYFTDEDMSGLVKVNFIYNGKKYEAVGLSFEQGYPVLNFLMPEELQNLLGGSNACVPESQITVQVLGIKDKDLNNVTYQYDVNFFDIQSEMPSSEDIQNLVFDYKYYADKNPDLKKAFGYNEEALRTHWLYNGITEGRKSSPVFDVKYYLYNNKDLINAYGIDYRKAYEHFINMGWAELRASSAEYCGEYYKNANPDLQKFSSYKLIVHYLSRGKLEGRKGTNIVDLTPIDITPYIDSAGIIFDGSYYLAKYPGLKTTVGTSYEAVYNHFITIGIYEGRQSSRVFDVKYYVEKNADVKKAYGDNYSKALKHFATKGMAEGRPASSEFIVKTYQANYADLQKAYGNDYKKYYVHFISRGYKEKRNATELMNKPLSDIDKCVFNAEYYLAKYPDIKKAYGTDATKAYNHFITKGIKEGRQGSMYFNVKYYLAKYPDLQKAYGNDYVKAYNHFKTNGLKEGRIGSAEFNVKTYQANYADLQKAYGNNYLKYYLHYMTKGIKENRKAV